MFFFAGKWMVDSLLKIARFLGWREFVVTFFVMAFASSIPNLFLGITSALHKIPQLSFGDIMGNNIINMTLAVSVATLLLKKGLPAKSRMVQTTSIFTIIVAILPLILMFDGLLSRQDAVILILFFFVYVGWLFSNKERFTKTYAEDKKEDIAKRFSHFIFSFLKLIAGIAVLFLAAEGMMRSAFFFSVALNMPLVLIGVLIVSVGNAMPETYFAIVAAKEKHKGHNWMILGDLMGSVIVLSTLVLGVIALIQPIYINDFSSFLIARIFLIIAALFFFISVRTDRQITKKEALFLLGIYITFLITEVFVK